MHATISALPALLLTLATSCSGGSQLGGASDKKDAKKQQTVTDSSSQEDDEAELAVEPENVSGAFLTCDLQSAEVDRAALGTTDQEYAIGCRYVDPESKKRATLTAVTARYADDFKHEVTDITPAANSSAWQTIFSAPRRTENPLVELSASIRGSESTEVVQIDLRTAVKREACGAPPFQFYDFENDKCLTLRRLVEMHKMVAGKEVYIYPSTQDEVTLLARPPNSYTIGPVLGYALPNANCDRTIVTTPFPPLTCVNTPNSDEMTDGSRPVYRTFHLTGAYHTFLLFRVQQGLELSDPTGAYQREGHHFRLWSKPPAAGYKELVFNRGDGGNRSHLEVIDVPDHQNWQPSPDFMGLILAP